MMLLNRVEKALMNNPVRSVIQHHIEAQQFITMGGRMSGGVALEVGCGRGVGVEIILDVFGAQMVDAFDLDPHMVALARQRLIAHTDKIHLWTGDVTKILAGDNRYDAVFDFAILHHVPNWRDGLKEVHRVLKPRGRFYAEEVLEEFITHPIWRRVLQHPQEDRFDHDRFVEALRKCGFEVISTKQLWQQFGWFVADKRDMVIHKV